MSGPIINESTSIIQISSAGLQNGNAYVVYVSSTAIPGQLVTVIDGTGFLSSPQYILLSTVGSAQIVGSQQAILQQRFGYISLVSLDTNRWLPVNYNAFTGPSSFAYRALDSPLINVSTLAARSYYSTIDGNTIGLDVNSTMHMSGTGFLSSLIVNSFQQYISTNVNDPRANIIGSVKVYGSTNTIGTVNIRGVLSTTGECSAAGNISSKLGTIYIGGNLTTTSNIRVQRGTLASVLAVSSFSAASFNSLATMASSVSVAGSVSAYGIVTGSTTSYSISAASSIGFGAGTQALQYEPAYLNLVNLSITNPSMSSISVISSNAVATSNLYITNFGPASTLQRFDMAVANIVNTNGSVVVSSIGGSNISLLNMTTARYEIAEETSMVTMTMNDNPGTVSTTIVCPPYTSTILARENIYLSWFISSVGQNGSLLGSRRSMSTNLFVSDYIETNTLNTVTDHIGNFKLDKITLHSTLFFSSATLLSVKNTLFNNTGGAIKGSKTEIARRVYISTIQTDLISSPNLIKFSGNSSFFISTAGISSLTSRAIVTSSFAFTNGNIGRTMAYSTINPSTPWLLASTYQMNDPPFTTTYGLGTYFNHTTFAAAEDQTAYYSATNPNAQIQVNLSTPYINTTAGTGIKGNTGEGGQAINANIGMIVSQPAVDSQFNVYFGENTVGWRAHQIDRGGVVKTVAGNYQYFYGDGQYPTGAALGPRLAVSLVAPGTILVTDISNVRLRLVNTDPIIFTVAGTGSPGYGGDGGLAVNAQFQNPNMTVADSASNIYIADTSNNMIRKYANSTITLYAGTLTGGSSGDGGPALSALFAQPYGLAVDSANLLYITDTSNCVIRTVNPTTSTVQKYAGTYTKGFSGDGGLAINAKLSYPRGITADISNNIYVCDTGNSRIRRIDHTSFIISTIAGNGVESYSGDNGPAYLAGLSSATGVTTDGNGNLYIADTNNNCIRFVDIQTGIIRTVAGQPPKGGYAGNNSFATTALLSSPSHVVFDKSSGYYYFSDDGNRRIRFVNSATGVIYDYVGNGSPYSYGDQIPPSAAVFGTITGLATDQDDNLLIADGTGHVVRKIDYNAGIIYTLVGTGSPGNGANGDPGSNVAINNPHTIITDSNGDLLFCDTNNHQIRKYMILTQTVTTIAGTGSPGYGGDGGLATAATLRFPKAIAYDRSGNIFIGDSSNYAIRRVDSVTGRITTYAGTGTPGTISAGGYATTTPVSFVSAVATDATNTVYFTDISTNTIWQIRQSDTTFQPMNIVSTPSYLGDGGPLSNAKLSGPMGLYYNAANQFVICDSGNYRIRTTYNYGYPQLPIYLNMYLTFTNYFATSGLVNVYINGNTFATFDSATQQTSTLVVTDLNIYNYPLQNSNPISYDHTPYIQITQSGDTGYVKFSGDLWVNNIPNQGLTQNVVNNSAGIIMNTGVLEFPYALNGITIQNKYNDASTRNLIYTGSLNNASDPALKEKIQPANLAVCYETLSSLPLRTYQYIPAYQSTFQVRDRTRIGFITTEVAPFFPHSITSIPFEQSWANSTIQTLDVAQIKYTHLGATQLLMEQVSTLETEVAELISLRDDLRELATQRNVVL